MTNQELIIELATKRGLKLGALQKWFEKGFVPHKWRHKLLLAARKRGKTLPLQAFTKFGPRKLA